MVPARHRGERHLTAGAPASPCIGVCNLRAGTRTCEGCLRTIDEITEWSSASPERRRQILEAVARRRLEEPEPARPPARTRFPD